MPKYTFTYESVNHKVTYECQEEALPDLLNHIEWFLRGCSFVIPEANELDFVTVEDKPSIKTKRNQ